MTCFPCFDKQNDDGNVQDVPVAQAIDAPGYSEGEIGNLSIKAFTFRELASATKNFRQEYLIGEGGFGRIYKGTLQPNSQVVSVKQLDRNGMQGNKEFQSEVETLSILRHKNLVELIGYCADGDQRLLVYEYMTQGALDAHLLDILPDKPALDWKTRMKIAEEIAQGLEYLHEITKPPVVYRDLKSSNVMLDDDFNAKLFDYGLANIGQNEGGKMLISPRVIGKYGYCAPEYERSGELTLKSDIYSFGVVLLELVTGRRAIDTTQPTNDQNLVTWAQPYFKNPKKFPEMADPNLQNRYPLTDLNQVVGVAAMCIQEEPMVRPLIGDILAALSCLKLVGEDLTPPVTSTTTNTSHDQGSEDEDEDDEERTSSGDFSTDYSEDDDDDDDEGEEDQEEEMSAMYRRKGESNRSSQRSVSSSSNGSDAIEFEFHGGSSMRLSPSLRNVNNEST